MNISRIRQMILDEDISTTALRYLLNCQGECEHLDFKLEIDLENDYSCASFSKDVVGMRNVGGGYIVIGVEDKSWKPIGLKKRIIYDTKMLREKVIKSTGLYAEIDIVQHELEIDGSSSLFALVLIRAIYKHSKLRVPSVTNKDFHPQEKWGIRQGDIYTRFGDSTKKINSDIDLQNLIANLEARFPQQDKPQDETIDKSGVPDLHVGIGEEFDGYGLNGKIYLAFYSFYQDTDITEMFVQVDQFFLSKFSAQDYFNKIGELERSEIFRDSKYVGKSLKWSTVNGNVDEVRLKPNESARVLFLEETLAPKVLHFGFETIDSDEFQKYNWNLNGIYEVFVDVYGKIYDENKYRKRTFVVLIDFIQGKEAEVVRSESIDFYRKWFKSGRV